MDGTPVIVAVCTKGRPEFLRRALAHLARMQWPAGWSALVVDNDAGASAKVVVDAARIEFPVALAFTKESKPGYATVRNAAIAAASRVRAICFFDDDMVAGRLWLVDIYEDHIANPSSIVHSRIERLERIPALEELDNASGSDGTHPLATYGGTGGTLVPMTVFDRVGVFDPRYDRTGGEDTDLLIRATRAGFAAQVASRAIAFEEERRLDMSLRDEAWAAFDSGRLYVDILRHNHRPTAWVVVRAAVGLLPPAVRIFRDGLRRTIAPSRADIRLLSRRAGVVSMCFSSRR